MLNRNGNLSLIVYKTYEKTKELTLSVYEAYKLKMDVGTGPPIILTTKN